jgi:ABC-type lipoprotein release transport system permease subunit
VISTSAENENRPINYDEGTYNIVMVILKPGIKQDDGVTRLNKAFRDRKLDDYVRAVSWKDAMSSYEGLRKTLRISLMVLVNLIYLSAVLMIANTLSMAAEERTEEIGTMRTVGAQKGFIARMFAMETSLISFLFGGIGMVLGIIAIVVLAAAEIPISDDTLQMGLGGDILSPLVDLRGITAGIIQLAFVTIIAMVYPILVARRIDPIDAIRQH